MKDVISNSSSERPLPFILRVASEWIGSEEHSNGAILFKRRAQLTGSLELTEEGKDVEISDVGIFE